MALVPGLPVVLLFLVTLLPASAFAIGEIVVEMRKVDAAGTGDSVGQVHISETRHGVVFTPSLTGLPPGLLGFHVHENPNCGPREQDGQVVPAGAAGGHYDPGASGRHGYPWGTGHRGDLPALYVNPEGNAYYPVLAPRLRLAELPGRSLMVHVGSDNHADNPHPLGGGGARLYCGVIR